MNPSASADAPILEVQSLSIALPSGGDRTTAVRDVSFTVGRGEIVCLVGESGSGKSVIAQGVMGLLPKQLPVQSGRILLQGEDITHAPLARLRELRATRMSMIFQEPMTALNPVMTCGDQIDEVLREHTQLSPAERREKVLAIIKEVLLPDPERMVASYPHQLSGGQRQRIMIAMALVLDPVLLIADEPTTALDVTTQAQILAVIKKLQDEFGTALIMITHDLGVVAETADEIVVMYSAKVVEHAPVQDIFSRPRHPYTWGLMGSLPRLDVNVERLVQIPGQPPSLLNPPKGCRFNPRCSYTMSVCRETEPLLTGDAEHADACHLDAETKDREAEALFAALSGGGVS